MPLDTSIYNALLQPPKSVADYNAIAQHQQSNLLALRGQQQQFDDAAALRQATQSFGSDPSSNLQTLQRAGLYAPAQAYQKALYDNQKTQSDIGLNTSKAGEQDSLAGMHRLETSIKSHDFAVQKLSAITNPADVPQWIIENSGPGKAFTAEQGLQGYQRFQQALQQPGGYEAWKQQALQGGQSATETLKQQQAALIAANVQAGESQRNAATIKGAGERNAATVGATLRGQDITNATTRRGQDLVNARASDQQNAQQYMMTDEGLVALPRKGAPTATMVTTAEGQPLSKPLKDIPAGVNTAIIANSQNLAKAQQALELLGGGKVGELNGDKSATGWKGYAPQSILNRVDPSGVDTRAMIADLGSMVLHDRSGAAVTASESPRLLPFIPQATDDAATAKKKLTRFIQVYKQEQQALSDTYSKGQGYKPSPVGSGAAPAGGGGLNIDPAAVAAELKRRGH